MKNNRYLSIGAIVISVIAMIVVVGSLFGAQAVKAPITSTASNTPIPPTSTSTSTPDACALEYISATIARFDRLSREFSDAFLLVQNTPAAQLAPGISELQRIRRDAQDFAIPACLGDLKEYQLGFMNVAIDAAVILYSNFSGDPNKTMTQEQVDLAINIVNQRMVEANQLSTQYTVEMARLLGITLTPPLPTAETLDMQLTQTPAAP